jgi:hypothetical protein
MVRRDKDTPDEIAHRSLKEGDRAGLRCDDGNQDEQPRNLAIPDEISMDIFLTLSEPSADESASRKVDEYYDQVHPVK